MHFSQSKIKVRGEGLPALAIETELHVVRAFVYSYYISFGVITAWDACPAQASRCAGSDRVFFIFSYSLFFCCTNAKTGDAESTPSASAAVIARDGADKMAELFLERTVCAESDTVAHRLAGSRCSERT